MTHSHQPNDIPPTVRQFVLDHISSLEQLEVLCFLKTQAHQTWSADEIARELYIHPESAANRLADLRRRGLADVDGATSSRYQYAPASSTLDQAVSMLTRLYKERHVTIINLIFSKPVDHIRSFADAFKLKKEE